MAWVGSCCQQLRRLVPRCLHELSVRLTISTLRRVLYRAGYRWKRTRRSLKAQRDLQAFATCRQRLAALHQAEQRGEVAVYYADEVRFSRHAPVPYAWQPGGQSPVGLPAERGAGGGYSVLGLWRPADPLGTGRQDFVGLLSPTAFTADLFVAALREWVVGLTQPTVLVLDNASIHKAGLVQAHLAGWAAQGLTLLFLPPYSPELNRLEILWRFCWLTPADYQSPDSLLQAVTQLIYNIGSRDYWITFA